MHPLHNHDGEAEVTHNVLLEPHHAQRTYNHFHAKNLLFANAMTQQFSRSIAATVLLPWQFKW